MIVPGSLVRNHNLKYYAGTNWWLNDGELCIVISKSTEELGLTHLYVLGSRNGLGWQSINCFTEVTSG